VRRRASRHPAGGAGSAALDAHDGAMRSGEKSEGAVVGTVVGALVGAGRGAAAVVSAAPPATASSASATAWEAAAAVAASAVTALVSLAARSERVQLRRQGSELRLVALLGEAELTPHRRELGDRLVLRAVEGVLCVLALLLRDGTQPGLLAHLRIGTLQMGHQVRRELDELRVAPGEASGGREGCDRSVGAAHSAGRPTGRPTGRLASSTNSFSVWMDLLRR
jgi:hypothetical protein